MIEKNAAQTRLSYLVEQQEVRQLSPKEKLEIDELDLSLNDFDSELSNFEL